MSCLEEDGSDVHCLEEGGEGSGCLRNNATLDVVCCLVRDDGGSAYRLLEDGMKGFGGFSDDNDGR